MRIYACLLGEWVDITETATVADCQDPVTYFKENLKYENGLDMQNALSTITFISSTRAKTIE